MTAPSFTTAPTPPNSGDPANFETNTDTFLGWMQTHASELNTFSAYLMSSTFLTDVYAGASANPLPITTGGTGATSAQNARTNLGLGTAAVKNTGTSGDAVPLLNGANTWSVSQLLNNANLTMHKDVGSPAMGAAVFGQVLRSRVSIGPNADTAGAFMETGWTGVMGSYTAAYIRLNGYAYDKWWHFREDGNGYAITGSWINGSDIAFKPDLTTISDAISKVKTIRAGTYHDARDGVLRASIVANDVDAAIPGVVPVFGDATLQDGTIVKDALGLSYEAPMALLYAAFHEVIERLEAAEAKIAALEAAQA